MIRLLALLTLLSLTAAAEIIPSDRMISWLNVGVSNGLPDSSGKTVYTNVTFPISRAALQTTLGNCPANQVVQLPAGTNSTVYTDTLSWSGIEDGVVLRGAGRGLTVLQWSGFTETSMYWHGISYSEPPFSVEANLTETATQGAFTVACTVPSWVTVGGFIGIDEIDDQIHADGANGFNLRTVLGNGERNITQVNRVVAKTATNITLELPNYWPWSTARTAQIYQVGHDPSSTTPPKGWALEDLTLRYAFTGGTDEHPMIMYMVDSPVIKNVEFDRPCAGRSILTYYIFRGHYHGLYIHDSQNNAGGQGYGLDLNDGTTGCVVEHSLFKNMHLGVTVRYGSGGNAVVYCGFIEDSAPSGAQQTASYSHHGNCSYYNLIEGNYMEPKVLGDWTHGASALNTVFRNRIKGVALGAYDKVGVSLEVSNRFWNIVGNIVGIDGEHNKLVSHVGDQPAGSQGNIYKMGGNVNINSWYDEDGLGNPVPYDDYQYTNALRVLIHANYDTVNDAVTLNNPPGQSITESNLTTSFFSISAPTFLTQGSGGVEIDWPLYNPYDSSTFTNLPPIVLEIVYGLTNYAVASSGDTPQQAPGGLRARTGRNQL